MSSHASFHQLLERARQGEPEAAAALVKQFTPLVRRSARTYRTGGPDQARYDSEDIAQDVFNRLFRRLTAGELAFDTPEQIAAYLTRASRHRRADGRRQTRGRGATPRPVERHDDPLLNERPERASTPARAAEVADFIQVVGDRLPSDLNQALRMWLDGNGWDEIAAAVSGQPDAVRKRLTRALSALADDSGLAPPPLDQKRCGPASADRSRRR